MPSALLLVYISSDITDMFYELIAAWHFKTGICSCRSWLLLFQQKVPIIVREKKNYLRDFSYQNRDFHHCCQVAKNSRKLLKGSAENLMAERNWLPRWPSSLPNNSKKGRNFQLNFSFFLQQQFLNRILFMKQSSNQSKNIIMHI